MSALWAKVPKFYRDLIERAVKTFVQSFLGVIVAASKDIAQLGTLKLYQQAALAGVPALFSALTSILSHLKGDPDSASLVIDDRTPRDFGNGPPVLGGDVAEANAGALAADLEAGLRD